jgi:hypothetical protein
MIVSNGKRFSDYVTKVRHCYSVSSTLGFLSTFLVAQPIAARYPFRSFSHIESVPGGKFGILGGHSIGYSKRCIYICMCTCVLFRTVSEIQLFHCTVRCTEEQHAMSSHDLQSTLFF